MNLVLTHNLKFPHIVKLQKMQDIGKILRILKQLVHMNVRFHIQQIKIK